MIRGMGLAMALVAALLFLALSGCDTAPGAGGTDGTGDGDGTGTGDGTGGGGTSQQPQAADTTAPTLASASVTPTVLDVGGGTVSLSVQISDASAIEWCRFSVTQPDETVDTVEATLRGLSATATYGTTANQSGVDETYTVSVAARDAAGNEGQASVGTFTVQTVQEPPVPW